METKKCPFCQSEINLEAKKCRFCMEILTDDNAQFNFVSPEKETNASQPSLSTENETISSSANEKLLLIPASFDTYFNKSWALLALLFPTIKIFMKLGTESGLDFLTITYDIVISLLIYSLFQFMSNFQYNRKPLKILLVCYALSTSASAIFSFLEYFNEDWISSSGSLILAIILIFVVLIAYLIQIIYGFIVAISFFNFKTEIIDSKNFKLLAASLLITSFIGSYEIISTSYELLSGNETEITSSIVSFIFTTVVALLLIYSIYKIIKVGVDYNSLQTIEEDKKETSKETHKEFNTQASPEIESRENQVNPLIVKEPQKQNESKSENSYVANMTNNKSLLKIILIGLGSIIILVVIYFSFIYQTENRNDDKIEETQSNSSSETNDEETFSVGQIVIANQPKVYFYSEASENSITETYIVVGQEASVTNIENDFVFVSLNYNGSITKGYIAKNDIVTKSKLLNLSVTSSSSMDSQTELNYYAENVIDDDLLTWWSPKEASTNEWVKINFDETLIKGIKIHSGAHYPNFRNYGNLYYQNCRITQAKLEFSDGSSEIITIPENDTIETIFFEPRQTQYVKLVPQNWNKGKSWQDICVSHLMAF